MSAQEPIQSYSRVRLDPIPGIYQCRVYWNPVNDEAPLEAVAEPYAMVFNVNVVGDQAHASMCKSDGLPLKAWREFKDKLYSMGVTKIHFERHDPETGECKVMTWVSK